EHNAGCGARPGDGGQANDSGSSRGQGARVDDARNRRVGQWKINRTALGCRKYQKHPRAAELNSTLLKICCATYPSRSLFYSWLNRPDHNWSSFVIGPAKRCRRPTKVMT